jgi:hypothetical protein
MRAHRRSFKTTTAFDERIEGDFPWHDHPETEVRMMLIEPRGTLTTGQEGGDRTALNDLWI